MDQRDPCRRRSAAQRNWFLTGGPALQIDACQSGTPLNQFDVRVEGNLFGTSKNGLQQLVSNQVSAFDWIRSSLGNGASVRIGGANLAARNVFMRAASKTLGMALSSASATNMTVQGNYFGVAVDGVTPFLLPSSLLSPVLEVSRARIGGTGLGEGNLFVAHEATSVILVSGRAGARDGNAPARRGKATFDPPRVLTVSFPQLQEARRSVMMPATQ